ncbi:ferritin-like domain-containing protein [Micromonospora globbae]|uniref:Ferritin-like domain-containing protein n=1 Tax=Micromonospora globbae TaxID=1894969 RepID=A0A420EX61_9ACTN|nr:ferritin-like domain-containing protein [Micromonospora globbae]RKF24847.1 ferritin-like domain-containing protein [Micromonospora globbae]WTF83669.1 ferritin-like domain-containing protein [Micromonospora globbae]
MSGLSVTTPVPARLTWRYDSEMPRVLSLYERAKSAQWNASTDVDWSIEVPFGEPLPDDSAFAMASFDASPLARRGRRMWDTFRWELQSWMVSQFLHGEQGALVVAARLVEVVPDLDSKYYAASQAADEARHVEAFSRYLREKVPEPYPINPALAELLEDLLTDTRWDITALGMQIVVEALAMAAFRLANSTFHDRLICDITRLVARDEARHVSFGVLSLEGIYREMTRAELADREEMVLDAASLMRRRFLLEDVWERIEVDRTEGVDFASHNELMIKYRQAIFARVVTALANIGLLTPRVREGLERLDLIGFADRSIRVPRA